MNCRRVEPYLTAHAAGELPSHTDAWVRAHLNECAACAATVARHTAVGVALRAAVPDAFPPPPEFAATVAARIRERESHARRRLLPVPPLPPAEIARVVQENRDAILNGAATAALVGGAAWLTWRALRSLKPKPRPSEA